VATEVIQAKGQFGRNPFAGSQRPTAPSTTDVFAKPYTLEIENAAGDLIARLPKWSDGQYRQSVNEPSLLTFLYPARESDVTGFFTFPNRIVIRDKQANVLDRMDISVVDIQDDGVEETYYIEADGYLARLGRDTIATYSTNGTAATIRNILQAWFATYQLNTVVGLVSMGWIDAAIANASREIEIENKSILQSIRTLHETIGGYFEVDAPISLMLRHDFCRIGGKVPIQPWPTHLNLEPFQKSIVSHPVGDKRCYPSETHHPVVKRRRHAATRCHVRVFVLLRIFRGETRHRVDHCCVHGLGEIQITPAASLV